MLKINGLFIALCLTASSFAQKQGDGGQLKSAQVNQNLECQIIQFAEPNVQQLRQEDLKNDAKGNGPWRFGFNHETALNLDNAGTWATLPNGAKIWRLHLKSKYAQSINLTFENTVIPKGNELYVSNLDQTIVLGKFTEKHLYKGELGTELIYGENAIIEYYVAPENTANIGQLEIVKVTHGYRSFEEFQAKAFGDAAACNMNVNCPDGLAYEDQKRSVVMIVSGANGFCTGALINNTEYDGKPYVLTANHCSGSPASWVFRFNWESPDCVNPSTSPSFSSLSGAVLRAKRSGSDFMLLEITGGLEGGTVPASFNPFFAGWDRSGVNPQRAFGIHHPRGDIKKISFDDQAAGSTQTVIGGVTSDSHGVWKVVWDRNTTTQPVSSGSPLFDQNSRIIGQLWGGSASCSNLTGPDYYGRFNVSWNPAGSHETNQLKHWLDPNDLGAIVVDGYQPGSLVSLDASLMHLTSPTDVLCDATVIPQLRLVNLGQTTMTAAVITYGWDGNETSTFEWSGNLEFLEDELISLPAIVAGSVNESFSATLTLVNGTADLVSENNSVNSSVIVMENPEEITLNITLDCVPAETTWRIEDESGRVIYTNPLYVNANTGLNTSTFCLDEGCYKFILMDSYGDGMSGCPGGNGSLQILNAADVVLAELLPENANFNVSKEWEICVGMASVNSVHQLFDVFPNPSTGTVSWEMDGFTQVNVLDLNGKVLQSKSLQAFEKQMELSALVNGVYLLEFTTSNGMRSVSRIVLDQK